ncbi:MAG: hypothetical protein K2X03_18485 [Bryobacteraceae bacterium]|nr:hypothetical protein [Bryobacteraceae bacterium]
MMTMLLGAQDTGARGCRVDGGYAATLTGTAPGFGDVNGTGVIEADGNGNFTGTVGGLSLGDRIIGAGGQVFRTAVTGTYKIAKDCTLTFTMTFVALNTTVEGQGTISAEGREAHILVTSPTNVKLTGVARKQ